MRRDINDAWLRTVRPPAEGRLELRDGRVRGLVLRMTPAGVATWSVRARTRDGRQTRPALGTWPAVGVAEARRLALVQLAAIASGVDPVKEKQAVRAARVARSTAPTVAQRLDEWRSARGADPERPWSERYAGEVKRALALDVVPGLGKRPLAETRRAEWAALFAEKRKTAPGAASFLYRTVSSFLNFAEACGWIETPLLPRKGRAMLAPSLPPRQRALSDDELRAVWGAADREAPKLRAFARLLVLTAAREAEVAEIAAGEVDLDTGRWAIPAHRTKNRHPLTLPLGPLALAELRAVWPAPSPSSDWRLLGRSGMRGFQGFSALRERIEQASGVADWRWHDLRRTARTGMSKLGIPRDHAEAAINHISGRSQLERTYDRHDYAEEVLAASRRWQAHVASLVMPDVAQVRALRRRA